MMDMSEGTAIVFCVVMLGGILAVGIVMDLWITWQETHGDDSEI